jgi:hypothetical protein
MQISNVPYDVASCSKKVVSLSSSVSSTNKTDCHDITEILLKVALNTITITTNGKFVHVV